MGKPLSRCVILGAGPVTEPEALSPLLRADDWFIAADGGMALAQALDVRPAVLVADFDSGPEPIDSPSEVLRLPVEKDWTDTMAAAMLALDRGYREFLLLGCTGGRLDHTMANIAVMAYILSRGGQAVMADECNRVRLLGPGRHVVPPLAGWKLSLFAFGGEASGITLRQVKYPLTDATLRPEDSVGVSNEFLDCPAEIFFQKGRLLLFFSKDPVKGRKKSAPIFSPRIC